jgi:hypothetical protein
MSVCMRTTMSEHRELQRKPEGYSLTLLLFAVRHRVQRIFVRALVDERAQEASLRLEELLRACELDDLASVEDKLQPDRVSSGHSRHAGMLTILSESMTVCRRWATVITVTSRLSSVRSEAWITASVS